MAVQTNYLVSTTALSLTPSGTTIGSGNTQSGSFVVAQTLVRTGITASELLGDEQTWSIHYVVSAMATPYEMRLKLQRRNSGGTMQTESGYGTTRSATGTYDDNLTWTSGTWNANDQLALVWEHRRPSGTGNKNGTIDANGASYVDAPVLAGTNWTREPADSLGLSDELSRMLAWVRSPSDSLGLSDAADPVLFPPVETEIVREILVKL